MCSITCFPPPAPICFKHLFKSLHEALYHSFKLLRWYSKIWVCDCLLQFTQTFSNFLSLETILQWISLYMPICKWNFWVEKYENFYGIKGKVVISYMFSVVMTIYFVCDKRDSGFCFCFHNHSFLNPLQGYTCVCPSVPEGYVTAQNNFIPGTYALQGLGHSIVKTPNNIQRHPHE